ncbi:CLUMA_CG004852, isoform A [Clunio marinus]|uniref:CLUMA_CG004852, isoform A n=1 Tax=Clunio marinus TaxID=568069 RepID=A0A1J1HSY3_9DIPT|nr:CLUMA_CG004852, isoform A [Clunio marinus]
MAEGKPKQHSPDFLSQVFTWNKEQKMENLGASNSLNNEEGNESQGDDETVSERENSKSLSKSAEEEEENGSDGLGNSLSILVGGICLHFLQRGLQGSAIH